jgi:hypothetical protein
MHDTRDAVNMEAATWWILLGHEQIEGQRIAASFRG